MNRLIASLFALALPAGALACTPGGWQIDALTPADAAVDVPTDSRIVLHWRGYNGPEEIAITSSGVDVAGQLTFTKLERTSEWDYGLLEFTPDSPLADGQVIDVETESSYYGPTAFSFTVADGTTPTTQDVPLLGDVGFEAHPQDTNTTCDGAAYRSFEAQVVPTSDADANAWIYIYRADASGTPTELFSIAGPADQVDTWSDRSKDLTRSPDEECFVAVQIDGAGAMSDPSPAVCVDWTPPQPVDPGNGASDPHGSERGCNVAGGTPVMGWLALLPLAGLRRR